MVEALLAMVLWVCVYLLIYFLCMLYQENNRTHWQLFEARRLLLTARKKANTARKLLLEAADNMERRELTLKAELLKINRRGTFYYDVPKSSCRRCAEGKIIRRRRFEVSPSSKGETILSEKTNILWCNNCNYKGIVTRERL